MDNVEALPADILSLINDDFVIYLRQALFNEWISYLCNFNREFWQCLFEK